MNLQIFSFTKSIKISRFVVAIILSATIIVTVEGFDIDDNVLREKCALSVKCIEKTELQVHVINATNSNQPMRFYYDLNCSGDWYHYTWMVAEGNGTIHIEEHHNNISKTIKIFNHVATDYIRVKIKSNSSEPVFFRSDWILVRSPCTLICDANCTNDNEDFNRSSSNEILSPRMLFLVISILVNLAVKKTYFY